MCGLCLPHCPTYRKTGSEAESPRGRISLIQAMNSGRLEIDTTLRGHLDNCLLCRACENVCPSGVAFGSLMDDARSALGPNPLAKEQRIPLQDIAIDKKRQRSEANKLWLSDRTGLRAIGRGLGVTRALGLERFEQLAPSIDRPHDWQAYYPARGETRGDVALFTGCFGDMFDQATLDAAIQVLNAYGYGVHVPTTQTCCGALHEHSGQHSQAQQLAQQNLAAFGALNIEAVISCASGCGSQLSEYPQKAGGALAVEDISQFLNRIDWPASQSLRPLNKTVAVHEPCSLRNVLKQTAPVYALLARIPGLNVTPLAGNEFCCGAAGSYMIDHPEMADSLRADKVAAVRQTAPDLLVSSNIGCALHIAAGLRQDKQRIEVIHPVRLLAQQLA